MLRQVRASLLLPLIIILGPLLTFLMLKIQPAWDPPFRLPVEHFYIVSTVALLSAAVAVAVGRAGSRLRNLQVIFLSMAFTSLALIFALHGLSTPGFLMSATNVPAVAAQLSVTLTAFWLWMSVMPADHPLVTHLARGQKLLVPLWSTLLAVLVLASLRWPVLVAWMPLDETPWKWGVSMLTIGLALVAAFRYWAASRYSRFPLQHAVFYSAAWLAVAQVIMNWGEVWHVSWWVYHLLLLGGVVLMVAGLARQYGLKASLGLVSAGLPTSDHEDRLEAVLSSSIRALVVATEARDPYTAGHTYRVALLALRLGEAMGLSPEQLRALAQGAIVHDVGKIAVPDNILNKPGRLDADERRAIEQHPAAGYEMCKRLGFMKEELDVVRSHHERWDGSGYPDRLQGDAIPLLARILAIADVYDALTSQRSYRHAWDPADAHTLIVSCAGEHFDPACVEAWQHLLENEAGGAPHAIRWWTKTAPQSVKLSHSS